MVSFPHKPAQALHHVPTVYNLPTPVSTVYPSTSNHFFFWLWAHIFLSHLFLSLPQMSILHSFALDKPSILWCLIWDDRTRRMLSSLSPPLPLISCGKQLRMSQCPSVRPKVRHKRIESFQLCKSAVSISCVNQLSSIALSISLLLSSSLNSSLSSSLSRTLSSVPQKCYSTASISSVTEQCHWKKAAATEVRRPSCSSRDSGIQTGDLVDHGGARLAVVRVTSVIPSSNWPPPQSVQFSTVISHSAYLFVHHQGTVPTVLFKQTNLFSTKQLRLHTSWFLLLTRLNSTTD